MKNKKRLRNSSANSRFKFYIDGEIGLWHKNEKDYIYRSSLSFWDSVTKMGLLQEYSLIVLDVFQKFPYSKDRNELTAWLSLLTIEEALGMFSKALRRQLRNQANT